jgi:hypothetical protein
MKAYSISLITKPNLWLRWTVSNAIGEMLGLGSTFAVIAFAFSRMGDQPGAGMVFLSFLVAVASGAIEATIVGLAQWWAMHPWFPTIKRYAWWLGTLIGALLAYVLGYLPSTLMSLGQGSSQAPVSEPPQWMTLLLAAGLGMVAGAVLSFAQWLVLRSKAAHAVWWIPANMLAWMAGMPIIFLGMDLAQKGQQPVVSLCIISAALFLMGAVVGAIEGAVLTWMSSHPLARAVSASRLVC